MINKFLFSILALTASITLFSSPQIYFSPDDRPRNKLIELINDAQHRIYAAVYMITDKKIANALVEAKKRGLDVQIITDQSCAKSEFGKIKTLLENNIDVHVYAPEKSARQLSAPLMHDKFALIDYNKIWTGSYNWTKSASEVNQENAILISDDNEMYERFLSQFSVLKERCVIHKGKCCDGEEEEGMFANFKRRCEEIFSWLSSVIAG